MHFIREEFDTLVNQRRNYAANFDKNKINISSVFVMHSINSACTSQGAAEALGGAEVSQLVYPNFNLHNLKTINL